jgi:aerobic carbon-monoxide dehydrogenase large subunit
MTTTTRREARTAPLCGQPIRRVEATRFLAGQGQYLADVRLPGTKHAAILRSPVAHARIRSIDTGAAAAAPGVVAVFTGADLARISKPFSPLLPIPTIKPLEWYVLATGKVRYVGEPVAVVVADDRYLAEDALECIVVDYEELAPVTDAEAALTGSSALLYDEWGSNEFLRLEYATGDVGGAMSAADKVLSARIDQHRVIGLPLEGHGAIGRFDHASGHLTLYASSQQPHNLRTVISDITGLSEAAIRVIAPDMGGGFGNKQHFMREEALVAVLAMQLSHPVSWVQDRTESFTSSVHSRQQVHDVSVAVRRDGKVLGLSVEIIADVGNPVLYFTGASPAMVTTSMLTGTYDIPDYGFVLRCAATNKCPMGAYRGFGQPQAFVTIERVMDLVANELDLDPAQVRRINMIPDRPRPFTSVTGARYDVGSFRDQFEDLLGFIDYPKLLAERDDARRVGRWLGIGLASVVETTAPNLHVVAGRFGGFEMAQLTVQPDGQVTVAVGTKSQGQGHETVLAQVVADALTVPLEWIHVADGDTAGLPYGMGTWGSRSAVMGGGAAFRAAERVRAKMIRIAAGMLDVPADAVVLDRGMFRAGDNGGDQEVPFPAVAAAAYLHTFLLPPGESAGLSVFDAYDPGNTSPFPDEKGHMNVAATYATAAGAAVVEVDPLTGNTLIRDFAIVHDCGRMINPAIVDGQIQGAFAQAVGSVFLEEIVYDAAGQPLTASFQDYLVPAFGSVPRARIRHRETPSDLPGGFRGVGETGIVLAPAALVNAVADALAPVGVQVTQTNLGPRHVRELIRRAGVPRNPVAGTRIRAVNVA